MSNSQSSERPDLQDLVAYMQGRGSEALRAQVLKRLDEDESYLELMMDLVPMLREAGELADPDAVQDAAPAAPPAIRPLVSPIAAAVDAPLPPPAVAPPSRVVPFPESPSRRRTAAISLMAALIPAAVAIWIATGQTSRSPTEKLASNLSPVNRMVLESNDPWSGGAMRGGVDICDSKPVACFDAGAQLFELQVAIQQNWEDLANIRLANLATTLGKKAFRVYFPTLAEVPDGQLIELDTMKKQVEAGSRKLFEDPVLMDSFLAGACMRSALLAARADDRKFFEGRNARKLCQEYVGAANWKVDVQALEALYDDKRFAWSTER